MNFKRASKRDLFAELSEGMTSHSASGRRGKQVVATSQEDREDVALVRRVRKSGGRARSIADIRKKLGLNK